MTKFVLLANNKGGVGKTPAAYYIGLRWAGQGRRVTLMDLDGQANLTDMVAPGHTGTSIVDALANLSLIDEELTMVSLPTGETLQLLAATSDLYDLESELSTGLGVMRLYHALSKAQGLGDVVVIDTPPNLGAMTLGAIIAVGMLGGWVIVPSRPDANSVGGIRSIETKIGEAMQIPGCQPKLLGMIATQVRDTSLHGGWLTTLRSGGYPPLLGETPLRGGSTADYELRQAYAPIADLIWKQMEAA